MTKGLIPQRPDRSKSQVDEFIGGAAATKADQPPAHSLETGGAMYQKPVKFMLEIPTEDFRTQLKIEAIQKGYPNMSDYICKILERRQELGL